VAQDVKGPRVRLRLQGIEAGAATHQGAQTGEGAQVEVAPEVEDDVVLARRAEIDSAVEHPVQGVDYDVEVVVPPATAGRVLAAPQQGSGDDAVGVVQTATGVLRHGLSVLTKRRG
jgi:hypothetical protein